MVARKVWDSKDEPQANVRAVRDGRRSSSGFAPHPARKVDPDSCPAGYDPDVWSLVLLFGQLAASRRIHLAAGRPLLYAMLEERVTALRRDLDAAKESGKGAWSVDGVVRFAGWQELTEAAIQHEWTFIQNEYAADWFCNPVRFREMIDAVRNRGTNRHAAKKLEQLRAEREASGYYDQQEEAMMNPLPQKPKKPRPEFVRGHAV